MPWEMDNPLIAKDNASMLEVPLASKLAFQRLKNVFAVFIDYAIFSDVRMLALSRAAMLGA